MLKLTSAKCSAPAAIESMLPLGSGTPSLSVWCKIAGNVKSNHVSLMSYYATVRDKIASTPAEKVMPRLRAMLADLMYHRADVLRDPTRLIEQMVQLCQTHRLTCCARALQQKAGGVMARTVLRTMNHALQLRVHVQLRVMHRNQRWSY